MGRRPRAQIIIESATPAPPNPTPPQAATVDPPPTTGTVPTTRRTAQPRLLKPNAPSKELACSSSLHTTASARVKPSATRPPSPGPVASTSSSTLASAYPNAAISKPPTMDWSAVDRSKNKVKKTGSVVSHKSTASASSSSSRSSLASTRTARSLPAKSGQIVSITGLPAKFNTAKALATEVEQLGIPIQDIRIGRTTATLRSTDKKLLSKLSALSDVVNARLTLKVVNSSSQPADPPQQRLPSYSCVLKGVEHDVTPEDVARAMQDAELHPLRIWRIKSRATDRDTTLMRVVTRDETTVDHLLAQGLYMFRRRYRAEPSRPAPPQSIQCRRCQAYGHAADQCREAIKCGLCGEGHPTYRCNPDTQKPKCVNCGENHPSLQYKCPARPEKADSFEKTVPVKCVDKNTPAGSPEAVLSVDNVVRFTTMALLNLLPDRRLQIAATISKLSTQYFDRSVAVSYDGNAVHISVRPSFADVAAGR